MGFPFFCYGVIIHRLLISFLIASVMSLPFFCYGMIIHRPLLLLSSVNLIITAVIGFLSLRSGSPRSAAAPVKTKLTVVRFAALIKTKRGGCRSRYSSDLPLPATARRPMHFSLVVQALLVLNYGCCLALGFGKMKQDSQPGHSLPSNGILGQTRALEQSHGSRCMLVQKHFDFWVVL